MEAKVPQRIDMEDRIIGPLTLQQFFYLLFGGLFIYLLNGWTSGTAIRIIFYPIALVVGLLALALAFVKVQDRPFIFFVGSLMAFVRRPRRRVWLRGDHPHLVRIVEEAKKEETVARKEYDRARVADIVRVLDKPVGGDNGQNASQ